MRPLLFALFLASCLVRNPDRCDRANPECGVGRRCDFDAYQCVADVKDLSIADSGTD